MKPSKDKSKASAIARLLDPFQDFARQEASSGIVLLICTALALLWANSPWSAGYTGIWQNELIVGVGGFALSKPLLLWINDGLMVIFFFVVGLEIKREVLGGELSSIKQAALPIAAALGGVVVPAALYAFLNAGTPGAPGWGIPMATDIAFALGLLALLGSRVPVGLKIFLTALAIIDDVAAVLVIAVFYTANLSWLSLGVAASLFAVLLLLNRLGVYSVGAYIFVGFFLWLAVLKSGVHATIAGVMLALVIPAHPRMDSREFVEKARTFLDRLSATPRSANGSKPEAQHQAAVQSLETYCKYVEAPLHRLEHALHPRVAFFIMPVFALANAGVTFGGGLEAALVQPVSLGILLGLVFGKQIGITLFSWLAVRSRVAELPHGISWGQIHGVGCLGGVGFTMSLFIAALAFDGTELLPVAKIGILLASLISALAGLGVIYLRSRTANP